MRRWIAVVLVALVGCSSSNSAAPSTSTTTTTSATTSTSTTTTTTSPAKFVWPALDTSGPGVYVSPNGIILPVVGNGVVHTPCDNDAAPVGRLMLAANVVLDPGHGGNEPGAVGPTGLVEKDVNFDVTQDIKQMLEAEGASVVLTRTGDYNPRIKVRGEIATALHPQVFVSIHHNAEPDGPSDVPGNESYYQIANPDSKRLAGLIWEEITAAFTPFHVSWTADTDHGAKYREGSNGGDYYGILRYSEGITTVLSEAAFITNPPEEQLLRDESFKHAEASAIAKAITRFLATPDPGSGFVTPYPRTEPAGGTAPTCTDPTL